MSQLVLNIVYNAFLLLLIVYSFNLLFKVISFFHIAHAITITFGPYFTFLVSIQWGLGLLFAVPISVIFTIFLLLGIDRLIYQPLINKQVESWQMLVASLGVYVIFQNIISLIWGDRTISFRTWPITEGNYVLGGYLTNVQLVSIFAGIILLVLSWLFINRTDWGRKIKAVSSNPELSNIFGISITKVTIITYIMSSILAACAGILIASDSDMRPTMGFDWFLYAIVAMIIGGLGKLRYLIFGTLLLVISQQLSSYFLSSKWMHATAFIILIAFLAWKPYGFSGQKLKKTEV